MALTDKLTNIANAIRTQTDTTDKMTLDEMPEKISKLSDISSYFNTTISNEQHARASMAILKLPTINIVCIKSNESNEVATMQSFFYSFSYLKEVPKIELANFDYDYISARYMFQGCINLNDFTKMLPFFDKYKLCNCDYMFDNCQSIQEAQFNELLKHITLTYKPATMANSLKLSNFLSSNRHITKVDIPFDTSEVTSIRQMFVSCTKLKSISAFDCSSVTDIQSVFQGCPVETFGGFINLGKNLKSLTYFFPNLPSTLSHTSLLNILNGLYDISNTNAVNSQLNLGDTLLAKLSDEEKKIATDKGWILR